MKKLEYWGGNIPWVSAKDLKGSRINDSILHLTEEGVLNGTKLVPENTVLCVVRGMSLANEFRISLSNVPVTFNQDLKAICPHKGIDPIFLFYTLFARREHIRRLAGEASHGTKKLPTEVLQSVEIKLPDSSVQQQIASVASAYDDLIENNRRRIQLLEQSARLLYKEWFVRLRFPGHERVKIKNGVPEGWILGTIEELGNIVTGKTPIKKNESFYGKDIPFIKTPDMHGNTIVVHTEENLSEKGANSQPGKTLPSRSILVSCIGTVGIVSLNRVPAQTNQQINAIVPKEESLRILDLFYGERAKNSH